MSFTVSSPRLQSIANAALAHFTKNYGKGKVRIESPISDEISWRPTITVKSNKHHQLAFEVDDVVYPAILKLCALDLRNADVLVSAYAICPLEVFQSDKDQRQLSELQKHGFGLYTVDQAGLVRCQSPCAPIAQHISEKEIEERIKLLTPKLKVEFRKALATYSNDPAQGIQSTGRLIEALIVSIVQQAVARNWLQESLLNKFAADMIDELYSCRQLTAQRAALGGARHFMKNHRNPTSHAPKSAKDAADVSRNYRTGFMDSVRVVISLREAMQALKMKVAIHLD